VRRPAVRDDADGGRAARAAGGNAVQQPRFSIVIVTYRSRATLGRLLDALAEQRAGGDEVIVVDNASADGTADLAARHPAVDRVVQSPDNEGFARGCNRGAAAAAGEVLLFLNPDVVPEPGCLDALRAAPADWSAWMGLVTLDDGAHVNTAGGRVHYLGLAWAGRYGEPVAAIGRAPHAVPALSGACLAIRRPVWEEHGGFPERFFMYAEDIDLSLRMRLRGQRFGLIPAARVRHEYEFAKGAYKWRCLERNRWLSVLRTYPGPVLRAALPGMIAAEPALAAVALRGGWGRAKALALLDVLAALPRTLAERRAIQRAATASPAEFAAWLNTELDSPFLGRAARSRLLRRALAAYWRLARRLAIRG
jgi:GT2 family glycosyltransferase